MGTLAGLICLQPWMGLHGLTLCSCMDVHNITFYAQHQVLKLSR